jgi:hypothetical protein
LVSSLVISIIVKLITFKLTFSLGRYGVDLIGPQDGVNDVQVQQWKRLRAARGT